ncbi:zf-TFIIB domain-containing protein [bacterium]|nr:zf-TFIIB domain-containing protein [bacterium]
MSTNVVVMRRCPVCKSDLRNLSVGKGVAIDFCPRCRGSWFDADELHRVYQDRNAASALLLPPLPNLKRDPVLCKQCETYHSRSEKYCPECKSPLPFLCPGCQKPLQSSHREGISLDCCHDCKGVWLDGGELTALFKYYSANIQNRATTSDAGVAAASVALDMFIWAPELYIAATAQVLTHLPELASKGLEIAGDMPEIAGKAAEGVIHVAGSASDLATGAISGAIQVAGSVGEASSDVASSFVELILDLISGIFD